MYLFVCYLNEETLKGECWSILHFVVQRVFFRNACHLFIVLYHNETTQYLSTSLRFILFTVTMNWASHARNTRNSPSRRGRKTTYRSRAQGAIFLQLLSMFLYFHPFFFLQRTIDQTFCTRNIQGFILNHSLSINHHLRHFMLTAAVDTPTPSTWGGFGSGQTSHESSFHFAKFSRLSTNPLRSKSPLCRVILCLLSLK